MTETQATKIAQKRANKYETDYFIVYDPSDPNADSPDSAYFVATPEGILTYYLTAQVVAVVSPL